MVTKPRSQQCCQHSLEQGRSPCANYPRLPLWASPVSPGNKFPENNLPARPGMGVSIQLWGGSCPSLGGKGAVGLGLLLKRLELSWALASSWPEWGQCRGRRKAWKQGMFAAGVSWCAVRLGSAWASCSSCCPGRLQETVPGHGALWPSTAVEEALKKEAVKTMNLKMKNKPMMNEFI